ncbi:MAG: hypothetical protein ABIJ95_11920 [Pseudomonadota bacterium]
MKITVDDLTKKELLNIVKSTVIGMLPEHYLAQVVFARKFDELERLGNYLGKKQPVLENLPEKTVPQRQVKREAIAAFNKRAKRAEKLMVEIGEIKKAYPKNVMFPKGEAS